jgi:hypothetical protein
LLGVGELKRLMERPLPTIPVSFEIPAIASFSRLLCTTKRWLYSKAAVYLPESKEIYSKSS